MSVDISNCCVSDELVMWRLKIQCIDSIAHYLSNLDLITLNNRLWGTWDSHVCSKLSNAQSKFLSHDYDFDVDVTAIKKWKIGNNNEAHLATVSQDLQFLNANTIIVFFVFLWKQWDCQMLLSCAVQQLTCIQPEIWTNKPSVILNFSDWEKKLYENGSYRCYWYRR